MNTLRIVRYVLWGLVAVAAVAAGILLSNALRGTPEEPLEGLTMGAPFALVTDEGTPITEAAFRGHPSLIFFGFTFCPDVCPTALAEVSGWLAELGDEAADLAVYFVTVDPERDVPERLNNYLSVFDPRIVGITGPAEAVRAMLDSYHVGYERYETEGGYLMDHTASFYLLDGNGDFVGFISYNALREEALDLLRRLVREG